MYIHDNNVIILYTSFISGDKIKLYTRFSRFRAGSTLWSVGAKWESRPRDPQKHPRLPPAIGVNAIPADGAYKLPVAHVSSSARVPHCNVDPKAALNDMRAARVSRCLQVSGFN